MADTLRDLGVVVDHPAANVYEVASGDVEWLFVPLEAAAKMRASFILLGPLLARFGRVIISNPGGDRIGRRPVDLHVEAMRALGRRPSNTATATTSPRRRVGCAAVRSDFPFVSVMGTENAMLAATLAEGKTTIRPAAQEPEVDDLIAFLQDDGRGRRADRPRHHRDRGPQAPARRPAPRRPRSHRGRDVHRRRRGHGRQGDPRGRPVRPPRRVHRDARPDRRRPRLRHGHDRGGRLRASTAAAIAPATSRPRRIRASPPTSSRRPPSCSPRRRASRTSTRRSSRTAWSGWRGPPDGRRRGARRPAPRDDHGPSRLRGAEVEIGDLRAGASLILAALAADGTHRHPRCAPRSARL